MEKKELPIGYENFKEVIENNLYYVDKTKVIEELLSKKKKLTLFPRPRRFGKTLFMSMLNNFFNIEYKDSNKKLFENLYISNSKYYSEINSYPVISISFKGLKGKKIVDVLDKFKEMIRELFDRKYYLREKLREDEKKIFDSFLDGTASLARYELSLRILSEMLYDYHHKQVIILIDEYDVPIQNGYLNGFYNDVVDFVKIVFSSALKTNDSLKFSVLTGVLRVSKESLFSDLNNIDVYSIIDEKYSEYFGFTESETEELLEYYDLKLDRKVKKMYDGYNFGGIDIYNPWSILNYANRKNLVPYWINTSGNELIFNILNNAKENIQIAFEKLLLNESIIMTYNDKVTYLDLDIESTYNTIMNFLLLSGYLTVDKEQYKNKYFSINNGDDIKVKLPNNEVKSMFINMLRKITYDDYDISLGRDFSNAIKENNKEKIEEILNRMMKSMSFYDTKENFYHGYMLGLFSYFLMEDKYKIKSNRESGIGRFDLMVESNDKKLGIIIEFKIANNRTKEKLAKDAIKQMEDKEYYQDLVLDKVGIIYKYAIVFYDGKKCIVR